MDIKTVGTGFSYDTWDKNLMYIDIVEDTNRGRIFNCYIANYIEFNGVDDLISKLKRLYNELNYNIKNKYYSISEIINMTINLSYLIRVMVFDDNKEIKGIIKDYSVGMEYEFKNEEELKKYIK
ncbi:hypothetical protein [Anaerofustis stercorihominis]|uniref:Uncharacterized protein n=2 Tax=Anaerofustis stercorihominis TaxID=214853 RepID=B1C5R5_9FIRM|nr:hypothetical protein [Anaerofustis stercorihominis]EDS73629.1 hypothetical protein ANASTE_00053 [Anaerofustis stercorihominis DSM 17244]MCQ4794707.1 hypothetical protein [Anaerofustis stercorihominis]RGD73412.1 hypothetical protein DW687_10300 [Anaerofustis stercorihominis]